MKKFALALCAAAALIASNVALAQSDVPGESRAAPSKPATKAEKDAAKTKRKSEGASSAKTGEGRLEEPAVPVTKKKKATAEEKAAGKSSRKAAGTQATKEGSGRREDEGGAKK
jgi:hypothetical protein